MVYPNGQHDALVFFMIRRADWVNALFGAFQSRHLYIDGYDRIIRTLETLSREMEILRRGAETQLRYPKHDVPQCFWIRWSRLNVEFDRQRRILESERTTPDLAPVLFEMICLQVRRLTLCGSDGDGKIDSYAARKEELILKKAAALVEPKQEDSGRRIDFIGARLRQDSVPRSSGISSLSSLSIVDFWKVKMDHLKAQFDIYLRKVSSDTTLLRLAVYPLSMIWSFYTPYCPSRYQAVVRFGYFNKPTPQDPSSDAVKSPNSPKWNSRPRVIRPGSIISETPSNDEAASSASVSSNPDGDIASEGDIRDDRFYKGGLLALNIDQPSPPQPAIYDPYPDYNSKGWQETWTGLFRACEGPDGVDLDRSNPLDMMMVYPGNQKEFPRPKVGAFEAVDLDDQVCADRYSRYGMYGYSSLQQSLNPINWNNVTWGELQSKCFSRNAGRYEFDRDDTDQVLPLPNHFTPPDNETKHGSLNYKSRTAVLLRTWHDMFWTENLKYYVRSLIVELALHSGAEYEVIILVHVKKDWESIYHSNGTVDNAAIQNLKDLFIPPEFHDMVVFFSEKTLEAWYPDVEDHRPEFQTYQAVQLLSQTQRNFDFYWQLETDSRFTGHTYHFFERAIQFARNQARKYLWERNAYFYIEDTHGPWDQFVEMVDHEISEKNAHSVWGPVPKAGVSPIGPQPPVSQPSDDDYEWGVGDEADFLTFLPIFDPTETEWARAKDMWNLPPESTGGDPAKEIPRRGTLGTMSRLSTTLLNQMHHAQLNGWGLASEMTPATFSLWHGLKAVHVPHPIYVDGKWTPNQLAGILNHGSAEKMNAGPDSVWSLNHLVDHVLYRMSYLFTTQTGEDLFRRWMGYKVDPRENDNGLSRQDPYGRTWVESGDLREDLYGHLCYPSFFLHSVKNPQEQKGTDQAVPV
ncbi:hypothetical protein N7492_002474 [Penicillium capsulatum]|uniref:Uncharacterized protein n=1 Tax=Penicillium capsulatum TaxID=69766 RepID=A0A9W9IHX7_9EURO|nr:hypothetical protein N7492_002474 [Penicillium capsulatum]KAJ6122922.1 hypothetical protein N7512_005387 [Penicillium capsulatum]